MESRSAGPVETPSASVWSTAARTLRAQRALPRIERAHGAGPAPVTDGQAMYLTTVRDLDQALAPTSFVLLEGDLDADRLEGAMAEVVRVQPALRTTFSVALDGGLTQTLRPPPERVLQIVPVPDGATPADVERRFCRLRFCKVNLREGPVYGAALVRVSPSRHLLMLGFHHVGWDGWSSNIFFRELAAAYESPGSLAEPPVGLADIAAWQQTDAYRDVTARQLDYWRTKLSGLKEAPRLFRDEPLPPAEAPPWVRRDFPDALVGALRDHRAASGATLFILVLASCCAVCRRYTGATDLCFESKMANRTRPETRRLIGPLHGYALVRADLSGDPTFDAIVDQVRRSFGEAMTATDVNIHRLIDTLVSEGRIEMPVERVAVDWLTGYEDLPNLGSVAVSRYDAHQEDQPPPKISELMDLQLRFVESRDRLTMHLLRNADNVTAQEADDFMSRFIGTATRLLASPDRPLSEVLEGGANP